jgi:hypothetical protein
MHAPQHDHVAVVLLAALDRSPRMAGKKTLMDALNYRITLLF